MIQVRKASAMMKLTIEGIYVGAIIGLSVRSDGLGRRDNFVPGLVYAKLLPVKENRILLKNTNGKLKVWTNKAA